MYKIRNDNEELYFLQEIRRSNFDKSIIKKVTLEINKSYAICLENSPEIYILYCLPTYDKDFMCFDINNVNEFTIGYDKNNDIIYENALVAKVHAKIYG